MNSRWTPPFGDLSHDGGIEERERPAIMTEPAAGVLLRTAWGLHDPVETDELTGDNLHGTPSVFVGPPAL